MSTTISPFPKTQNITRRATAAGLLLCSCAIALGQPAASAEAKSRVSRMLDRALSLEVLDESMDLTVAVQQILRVAGTFGGIAELDGCGPHEYRIVPRGGTRQTTLKGALDSLVAAAPAYRWALSDEGAIDVLPGGRLPQFLQTEIQFFDWDVNSPMYTALANLSDSHEVRKRRLELNMSQRGGYGGLFPMPIGGPVQKPRDWRRVEHVSLLSALNAIAQSYGNGVWIYSECRRGDSTTVGLRTPELR